MSSRGAVHRGTCPAGASHAAGHVPRQPRTVGKMPFCPLFVFRNEHVRWVPVPTMGMSRLGHVYRGTWPAVATSTTGHAPRQPRTVGRMPFCPLFVFKNEHVPLGARANNGRAPPWPRLPRDMPRRGREQWTECHSAHRLRLRMDMSRGCGARRMGMSRGGGREEWACPA